MKNKTTAYDQAFKEQVVQYMLDHPQTSYTKASRKFGCHPTTINGWMKQYHQNGDQVIIRGSGNYTSDEAKEIARLKKELKDTQDALEVLKNAISMVDD